MLRRTGTGYMDRSFSIPAGGLDAGETIRMAAIREVQEEVGVEIDPSDLEYVHTLHSVTEGNDWVGHFFAARSWTGAPRICEPAKHSDLGWHAIACLPETTIPYIRQALLCIDAGSIYSEFGWAG
jgi:8-oxo-dGTP pyrophosphatase MutT (NUDIX family)